MQRQYMIFNITEVNTIDFSHVLETSSDTLRVNVAETKSFVKWQGDMPICVNELTTKEGPYTIVEIKQILNTSEWSDINGNVD